MLLSIFFHCKQLSLVFLCFTKQDKNNVPCAFILMIFNNFHAYFLQVSLTPSNKVGPTRHCKQKKKEKIGLSEMKNTVKNRFFVLFFE